MGRPDTGTLSRRGPMPALLRMSAAVCAVWAGALVVGKHVMLPGESFRPLGQGLVHALSLTYLALAGIFWFAARDPVANRAAVYGAVALQAMKIANDLYDVLVLLPADQAMVSLLDLVLSMGLFVGLLQAAPRTFRAHEKA